MVTLESAWRPFDLLTSVGHLVARTALVQSRHAGGSEHGQSKVGYREPRQDLAPGDGREGSLGASQIFP